MDPRETVYVRAVADGLAHVAEVVERADLLFVGTTRAYNPQADELVAAARRLLHPLGNLVVTGPFLRLCAYARALLKSGHACQELALPLKLRRRDLPQKRVVPNHMNAVVAFRDPGHIENPLEGAEGTLILGGVPLPPEAESIPALLVEVGLSPHLEVASETLAALVERYSHPGGLVVAVGVEAPRVGLLALLLARRALVVLERPEEVTAYRMAVRLLQDALPPSPNPGDESPRRRALRKARR